MPLSANRIRASYGHHGWRRTAAHRCVLVEITAVRTSDNSAGGVASNSRCSPSTTARSRPLIGRRQGDLTVGDNHLSAIGTLVERQTRMLRLVHLPRADSDSLHAALVARMQDLPPALMRSIIWAQGTEIARNLATADKLGAPVYFCDSRSPWQRGTNENTNGSLRDYFSRAHRAVAMRQRRSNTGRRSG